jgi:hypothetical protein
MDDWKMKKTLILSYSSVRVDAAGYVVPVRVQLFIILNPSQLVRCCLEDHEAHVAACLRKKG